jgi:hypothetical protein
MGLRAERPVGRNVYATQVESNVRGQARDRKFSERRVARQIRRQQRVELGESGPPLGTEQDRELPIPGAVIYVRHGGITRPI